MLVSNPRNKHSCTKVKLFLWPSAPALRRRKTLAHVSKSGTFLCNIGGLELSFRQQCMSSGAFRVMGPYLTRLKVGLLLCTCDSEVHCHSHSHTQGILKYKITLNPSKANTRWLKQPHMLFTLLCLLKSCFRYYNNSKQLNNGQVQQQQCIENMNIHI